MSAQPYAGLLRPLRDLDPTNEPETTKQLGREAAEAISSLLNALAPFAEAADMADQRIEERYPSDVLFPDDTTVLLALNITLGHLRDARAALNSDASTQTVGGENA